MYILDYSINNNAKIDVMVYILDCSINNNAKIDVMVCTYLITVLTITLR